jgi:predicted nuclease of predicted toxin-antitoxin system
VKFLIDAQLPRRLCYRLRERGHDSVHTLDLRQGNRTPDALINATSVDEERVVVTKDSDFVDSLVLRGVPYKLLLISTGNIRNSEMEALLLTYLSDIEAGFESSVFIEMNRATIYFHW